MRIYRNVIFAYSFLLNINFVDINYRHARVIRVQSFYSIISNTYLIYSSTAIQNCAAAHGVISVKKDLLSFKDLGWVCHLYLEQ